MNRRQALRTTSFVIGYSLTASAIATILQGCKPETKPGDTSIDTDWSPAFLDQEQVELVAELSETLIPETTTPGAKAVYVHRYIDDMLQHFYDPIDQYAFIQGLDDVKMRAQMMFGQAFGACNLDQRTELLDQIEEETKIAKESGDSHGNTFFEMLKSLTFQGYFSSEKIGEDVLAYDPVPGVYQGCIPLDEVGKLWSI